jgi:hypothetical protein
MKAFKNYLSESSKRFDFRLRIACEMTDDIVDKIKQVLEVYQVDKVSKPKRLPIQESPQFPNMGPVEINIIDVSLCYPCNDEQVRLLVSERAGIEQNCILVTPVNSPFENALAGLEQSNLQKPGEAVLNNPELTAAKPEADLVGDDRIPNLLKELEETRKYQYPDAAGGKVTDKHFQSQGTTNDIQPGKASPVGSKQNKVINPRKA